MATNGKAREVMMRPPPKEQPKPKTVEVGNLAFPATMIEGRPYARVHQRVEAAHEKGGYSVVSRKVEEVAGIWCYCVEIELPNGQRFPGDAEIDKTQQKPIAKAQTRAIGRALAFAGFHIKSSIASEEEMEGIIEGHGEVVVSDKPDLKARLSELGHRLDLTEAEFRMFLHAYEHDGKLAIEAAVNALEQMLVDREAQ